MGTIVVVDDHPLIRLAVRILLENHGHRVLAEASNGVDAIQLVRMHEPDVVVLDLDIPKLDGLSVMAHFKSNRFAGKVLVLTASSPTDFSLRCLKLGAAGFISKEEEMNKIADGVDALLSGLSYFPSGAVTSPQIYSSHNTPIMYSPLTNREITILRLLVKGKKI